MAKLIYLIRPIISLSLIGCSEDFFKNYYYYYFAFYLNSSKECFTGVTHFIPMVLRLASSTSFIITLLFFFFFLSGYMVYTIVTKILEKLTSNGGP